MKIKNELVSIRIGNKHYDFNNLILDTYLQRFAISQFNFDDLYNNVSTEKSLRCCMLKFDTPLENLQGNSELHNQDFDIYFGISRKNSQVIGEKQILIQYEYEMASGALDYKQNTTITNLSEYYGRKITAIGFNTTYWNDENSTDKYPVCAVLDTSNYNIYLQEKQELSITRKDIITTDALFYSNTPKYSGPLHLAPINLTRYTGPDSLIGDPLAGRYVHTIKPKLYSIGLSSYYDYIDKEFIIGDDIEVEIIGTEVKIKGVENNSATENPLFASNKIYPSSNLYPIKSNYKYIILKYQIWEKRYGAYENPYILTDNYYYQSIPIDKFGKSNLKIKYERG